MMYLYIISTLILIVLVGATYLSWVMILDVWKEFRELKNRVEHQGYSIQYFLQHKCWPEDHYYAQPSILEKLILEREEKEKKEPTTKS